MFGTVEGTGYRADDERFLDRFVGHARVERLWTGGRWLEGPAWFSAGRYLVFSDIPNDRMLRYDDTDGSVSVFREPAGYSNGNAVDRHGRLVTCEHGNRRLTRTELDGSVTILADSIGDRRLSSPNDVAVATDGAIWFTDPPYGIMTDYEGHRAVQETEGNHLYRIDPDNGAVEAMVTDFQKPNGLAFSADGQSLYVVDSGCTHDAVNGHRHIRKFIVSKGTQKISGGDVFSTCDVGFYDGIRTDLDGRIWAGAGDGVHCIDTDGTKIGRILIPETVANLTFGGPKRNRLFICGTTSLYAAYVVANGSAFG